MAFSRPIFDIEVSTLLRIQFIPVGIFTKCSKIYENLLVVLMNFLFVIVTYSLFRNYSYLDSYLYKMDNTVYVLATVFVVSTFWISRYQKPLIRKIFDTIAQDEKDDKFARLIQLSLKPLLLRVTSWHTLALCLTMMFPIFAACFTHAELGSTPTLLFPSWFPWQVRTKSQYIFTILIQFLSGSLLYSLVLSQEIIAVCYIAVVRAHIVNFCRELRELENDPYLQLMKVRARKLPSVEKNTILQYSDRVYEEIIIARFRKILGRFLRIHRFVKDVVDCSNRFSANSLFIFFDVSVLLTATFLQNDNDLLYSLRMVSGELLGCTTFAVFCYLGEIITRMNEVFRDALYSTRWYQRSPKLRKRILILMQLTHLRIRVRAVQMYTIEIVFFGKIVKLCFSLLRLFINLQNK